MGVAVPLKENFFGTVERQYNGAVQKVNKNASMGQYCLCYIELYWLGNWWVNFVMSNNKVPVLLLKGVWCLSHLLACFCYTVEHCKSMVVCVNYLWSSEWKGLVIFVCVRSASGESAASYSPLGYLDPIIPYTISFREQAFWMAEHWRSRGKTRSCSGSIYQVLCNGSCWQ